MSQFKTILIGVGLLYLVTLMDVIIPEENQTIPTPVTPVSYTPTWESKEKLIEYATEKNTTLIAAQNTVELEEQTNREARLNLIKFEEELHCLQLNIYWEARNQTLDGKIAIAAVTLNRVKSKRFPNTVCAVVYQASQFSWYWDGLPDDPKLINKYERRAWKAAGEVASDALRGRLASKVGNATHYHSTKVDPWWNKKGTMVQVATIKDHIFYSRI